MESSSDDEALMLRYRGGDAEAFDLLYARHKGPLYRYLLRQCATAEIAQELFQDVWLGLIKARQNYSVQAKFTTYLYRLAHNHLVDHYRRQSRRPSESHHGQDDDPWDQLEADCGTEPPNQVHCQQLAIQLMDAIRSLPETQREAFVLKEEAGLSLQDIAQTTGVSIETTKSRLRYAVTKLRRLLGGKT